MTQTELFPWSGYGWIFVTTKTGTRNLFALVYHTWDRWFAVPSENSGLRKQIHGTLESVVAFGELVRPLTVRVDE